MVRGVRNAGLKRRKFTREVKLHVVREVEAGKPVAQAAREREIHPTQTVPLTSLDQVWQADITSIRLPGELVYLAVILDSFSRRSIGWALDRALTTDLSLCALRIALAARPAPSALMHHSDQGVQYASSEYTKLLTASGLRISQHASAGQSL